MSSQALLLDTHIWVRYINGDSRLLRTATVDSIEVARVQGAAFVSVMSIWEIAMLVKKGRLTLPTSVSEWTKQALTLPGIRLLAVSPEALIQSVEYPPALNADPSDRILLASAQSEGMTFLTADKDILHFATKHKLRCLKA